MTLRPSARISSSAPLTSSEAMPRPRSARGVSVWVMMTADGRQAIIRKRHRAFDVEFEAILSLVVADGGHASGSRTIYAVHLSA